MTQTSDIQSKAVETIISFIGGMYRNNEVQTLDNGDVAGVFDHEIGNSLSAACEWSASDRFAYVESLVVVDETLGEEVVLTASDLEEIKESIVAFTREYNEEAVLCGGLYETFAHTA